MTRAFATAAEAASGPAGVSLSTWMLVGLLLAVTIFGRRAQKAAYGQMEGQVGAAASALTMLRRGWKTDPVVGFNRQ